MNEHLSERFGRSRRSGKGDRRQEQGDQALVLIQPQKLNTRIREYVESKPAQGGSWLRRPEYPTSEEILDRDGGSSSSSSSDIVVLSPNKPEGPFENVEDYLSTQYELLREDAVKGLRDAVAKLSFTPEAMEDAFSGAIGIYDKVRNNSAYSGSHLADESTGTRLWRDCFDSRTCSPGYVQSCPDW